MEEGLPAEEYLVLDEVRPEMLTVKKLLEQAVPGGSAASAAPVSSLNSWSSPGGTGMGALPGLGGMAGGGVMNPFGGGGAGGMGGMPDMERAMRMMENPAIRRITQGVMSNPRMMQVMQESMQSGNPMAMMQDPEFQQTMQGIMSDPEMLAAMQNPDTVCVDNAYTNVCHVCMAPHVFADTCIHVQTRARGGIGSAQHLPKC